MTKCQEYLRLRDGSAGLHRKAGHGDATCTCSPALCGVDRGLLGLAGHQFNFRFRERLSVKGIKRAENERSGHKPLASTDVHWHTDSHVCIYPPPSTHTHTKDGLWPFSLPPNLSTPNLKSTEMYRLGKGCVNTRKVSGKCQTLRNGTTLKATRCLRVNSCH